MPGILIAIGISLTVTIVWTVQKRTEPRPEDTIQKLEKGLNEMDMDAVLSCYDSQMQDLYSGGMGVLDSLLGDALDGVSLNDLMNLGNGLGGILVGQGQAPKYTIEINNIDYPTDDTCEVDVTLTQDLSDSYLSEYADGTGVTTEEMTIPMKIEDGSWKISADVPVNP